MKRNNGKTKKMFFAFNIFFLALISLSVLIMPYNSEADGVTVTKILSGAMFWSGSVGTAAFAILTDRLRRNDESFDKKRKKSALTHFFQNLPAKIFDSLLISAIVGFILSLAFSFSLSAKLALISAIIFSFGMHCMLDGINFIYVMKK